MLSTTASTVSPFFKTSEGCATRLLQLISEMWMSPSMPFFDFDERSEISQVSNRTLDASTGLVFVRELLPGVGLDLLQAEADAALAGIHLEHHGFDFIAHVQDLRGMFDTLAPRHFRDMDEPFDSGLELDESAIIREADDFALDSGAGGKAILSRFPRVGRELLVAERDSLRLSVELQHDDFRLVAHVETAPTDAGYARTTYR